MWAYKKLFGYVLSIWIFACVGRAISNPNSFDFFFRLGTEKLEAGLLDDAVIAFTRAIELEPNPIAFANRGSVLVMQQKSLSAVADFTRAIELFPTYSPAYYGRGNAKEELHDIDGAIADYSDAIRLNPNYTKAYTNRGIAWFEKGDLNKSLDDYDTALKITPDDAVTYVDRGAVRMKKFDYKGAIEDYTQALKFGLVTTDVYTKRGDAYLRVNEPLFAISDFTKGLELAPSDSVLSSKRGEGYWLTGKYQLAADDFLRSVQNAKTNAVYTKIWLYIAESRLGRQSSFDLNNDMSVWKNEWARAIVRFLTGAIDSIELNTLALEGSASRAAKQRCEALYYQGMAELIKRNQSRARELFEECSQLVVPWLIEQEFARAELERINDDGKTKPNELPEAASRP